MNFFGRPKEAPKPRVDKDDIVKRITGISEKINQYDKKYVRGTQPFCLSGSRPVSLVRCFRPGPRISSLDPRGRLLASRRIEHYVKLQEHHRNKAKEALKAKRTDGAFGAWVLEAGR